MEELPPIDRSSVLLLLGTTCVVLAAVAFVAWRTRGIRSLATRILVPTVTWALALSILYQGHYETWIAQWSCVVCGEEEVRLSWRDQRLLGSPSHLPQSDWGRRYHSWFLREIGGRHEHDWSVQYARPVGGAVTCERSIGARPFHSGLPLLPDQSVARALALRLLETPPHRRSDLLRDFEVDMGIENPVRIVAWENAMSADQFRDSYSDWLDEHPLWR